MLQTDFNKQTSTDTFYVPYPGLKEGGFVQTDFLLKRGLLVGAPTVVMANGLKLFGADCGMKFVFHAPNLGAHVKISRGAPGPPACQRRKFRVKWDMA